MKILLLCWRDTGHPEGGGSERYLERVAAYLAAQGHQVVFRTAAYPGVKHTTVRDGITFSRGGGNFTVYIRAWAAMAAARIGLGPIAKALGGKPDVVVDTQNGVPFFARIFSGAPTVLLTHHCHREQWPVAGPMVGKLGWFIESKLSPVIHRDCRYITVSQPSAEDLIGLGIDEDRITIIRNGIDPIPESCSPKARAGVAGTSATGAEATDAEATGVEAADADVSNAHPSAPTSTTGPRLVTLSRLVPHKQIEHAIDVLAAIIGDHPNAVLDIIGSGWWAEELEAYAHRCGLADHIVFHGQVSEEEKHEILAGADVHLMPSRKEGWGLAVIEAAQHGVPTLGYRSSAGLKDSVVDGETGILVDTPAELANATRDLLHDAPRLRTMATKCVERAAQFGWESTAKAVEQVLEHPKP